MTHKEMTAHLRKRVRIAGIKARVDMMGCNTRVFPAAYGVEFSEEDQRQIRQIAKSNHFTLVRGVEIDVERMTDPHGVHFEYHPQA